MPPDLLLESVSSALRPMDSWRKGAVKGEEQQGRLLRFRRKEIKLIWILFSKWIQLPSFYTAHSLSTYQFLNVDCVMKDVSGNLKILSCTIISACCSMGKEVKLPYGFVWPKVDKTQRLVSRVRILRLDVHFWGIYRGLHASSEDDTLFQWVSTLASHYYHGRSFKPCWTVGYAPRDSELLSLEWVPRCSYITNVTSQVILMCIQHSKPVYPKCYLWGPNTLLTTLQGHWLPQLGQLLLIFLPCL